MLFNAYPSLRRCSSRFVASALVLALTSLPSVAAAQVSDADRAAARELYVQGVELQNAGKFAEALDRFNRAQTVFSAPTNLLHIAECEAAVGKLVEAAETYRTLVRTPLRSDAPEAFVQAQKQGGTELAQVAPRLPSVRISVRPENASNVAVQIDGQVMSSALLGVQRPTDPGPHTIVVSASGYARASQRITLQEKENRDVPFVLQPSGGIVYGTLPPATTTPAASRTVPLYGPAPSSPSPYSSAPPAPPSLPPSSPPPPPPYAAPPEYEATTSDRRPATGGFMLGPTLGLAIPAGALQSGTAMSTATSTGAAIGLEGGFRFVKRLYLGLVFQHDFLGSGNAASSSSDTTAVTYSASGNYYGLNFAYISRPDGVAFYGEIGGGFRTLATGVSANGGADTRSQTWSGAEGSIGIGVHIKIGDWVRLIPKASIAAGQFSSVSCSSSGNTGCASGDSTIGGEDTHMFVFLGITGFVDFARKH